MTSRVLITGATGTVGSAIMRLLSPASEAGHIKLLGTARSESSASLLRARNQTPVMFDFEQPSTMKAALEAVDTVFLATGYSGDMVAQSVDFLDAASECGVRKVVHLGALAAANSPHQHFAWHQTVEREIESRGFSWTHLQPNFFMDTLWAGYRHRPDRLVHFVADQPVSWIAVSDIAAVAAAVLRDPQDYAATTIPLATQALTFPELATVMTEETGRVVDYRPRPASDLLGLLEKQGMDARYAEGLASGLVALEAGELPLADAVFDNVETITGRPPLLWPEFIRQRLPDLRG